MTKIKFFLSTPQCLQWNEALLQFARREREKNMDMKNIQKKKKKKKIKAIKLQENKKHPSICIN